MRRCATCFAFIAALSILAAAQSRPAPTPAEFGQFESLATYARGGLSPDGKWLAYGITKSNRDSELRVTNLADGTTKTAAFGATPAFSADSKWVAYGIGMSEAQDERLRRQRRPVQRKLGLLNLASGETSTVDGIESFAFDSTGTQLVMRRYVPERPAAPAGAGGAPGGNAPAADAAQAEDTAPIGATIVVRDLASGRDTTFGNVAEYSWQDKGRLLAVTISAEDKTGNGVQVFDPSSGSLRVLDSSSSVYSGLTWRREGDDLVVLRSKTDEKRDGAAQIAIAWYGVSGSSPQRHQFDPTADRDFPAGMRTVSYRRPSWSDDGKMIFLGISRWDEKIDAGRPSPDDEEPASVDIWHAKDIEVMSRQKLSARTDRQRNLLGVWHVGSGKFVQLAKDSREQVVTLKGRNVGYVANWDAYAMERTIGRPAADISLVDLNTGTRTKLVDRIDDGDLQASPNGRYLLFVQADNYWTIDTASRAITNITKTVPAVFVNRESDATVKQKPPFGVAGWTKDETSVLLYDKLDIWDVKADGSRATKLTDGALDQVRHRVVRLNPDEPFIDVEKPLTVSLFGIWSKKSGYGRVTSPAHVDRLVWLDRAVDRLARAKDADVYAYVAQDYSDSPDVFVAHAPDLNDAKQVTRTNPSLDKYAWGKSETIDYKSDRGERLQATLYYPAGYEAGKKYPTIVYIYERLSDGVHRFVPPNERDYYNTTNFTSRGYAVLQPDITFRPREPGLSVVECVSPAVKKAVALGVTDAAHVGVVGHSWGGFDTAFLATHTDIFAAAVAGAPITDLVSNYGNHHWSSGIAETDHIETGQQRMEVPLYEDLPAYIRNSAVFNVQNMKTPLMIEVGDQDGTVFWHQGIELYNIARRANKNVVLLAYAGEDHGLRRKQNQIDYHNRIVQWFGHYLKGEPAAPWIEHGLSFLDKEIEQKKAKAAQVKKGTS